MAQRLLHHQQNRLLAIRPGMDRPVRMQARACKALSKQILPRAAPQDGTAHARQNASGKQGRAGRYHAIRAAAAHLVQTAPPQATIRQMPINLSRAKCQGMALHGSRALKHLNTAAQAVQIRRLENRVAHVLILFFLTAGVKLPACKQRRF